MEEAGTAEKQSENDTRRMGGNEMIKKLKITTKYFATQELEGQELIEQSKDTTDGQIVKQQIDRKNHADYGEYFEVTVVEELTTSKSILENGY